jgi:hypothetical protein
MRPREEGDDGNKHEDADDWRSEDGRVIERSADDAVDHYAKSLHDCAYHKTKKEKTKAEPKCAADDAPKCRSDEEGGDDARPNEKRYRCLLRQFGSS